MADLFSHLQPRPAPIRIAVAQALASGMTRPLRDIAASAGLTELQARTALNGLRSDSRVHALPDGYWSLTPRGMKWLEEVRHV